MKKLSIPLILLGISTFAIAGCEPPVEEATEDVVEAREDLQEEKVEAVNEVEGELNEADREITNEQKDLVEERQDLEQTIDEKTVAPAETTTNVEGDTDAIEEVEPQN